jgi:hypothetical protein
MLGSNGPRKALAAELSQVVLLRETILRHAEVLARPDLIEIPAPASALGLWSAVLQRAEAEAAVPKLVQAVLVENSGAEALKTALQEWLDATRSVPPAPPHTAAHADARPTASSERPILGAFRLRLPRWAVALAAGLLISWSLLQWRPSRVRIFQLFNGPHAAGVTERELAQLVLDCWNRAEGSDARRPEATTGARVNGDPQQRISKVTVRLVQGQPGQFIDDDDQGILLGASTNTPRFKRCVRAAKKGLLSRMAPGEHIQAEVALPLKP